MKEQELNAMMSVVSDPIENVYKIDSYKDLAEIQRIIRIFDISEEQELKILNAKSQFSDYVVMLPKEYTDLCETSCFNYLFLFQITNNPSMVFQDLKLNYHLSKNLSKYHYFLLCIFYKLIF